MSDSVRPHRRQPTRLPRPWDSPSKNTGVGCHFLPQCMKVKSESEDAQLSQTPSDPMDCSPPGPSIHGIFPGKSTGVGCHCLLRYNLWHIHKWNDYTATKIDADLRWQVQWQPLGDWVLSAKRPPSNSPSELLHIRCYNYLTIICLSQWYGMMVESMFFCVIFKSWRINKYINEYSTEYWHEK